MTEVLSVRQLNTYVKSILDGDKILASCRVTGEIIGFKKHFSSGHIYFTLTDGIASIRCVMFKANVVKNNFVFKDGMVVDCIGSVSLYEKDGGYQYYVERMSPQGEGNKLLALERLKEKLFKEGLFNDENKRALPKFPKNIAVVTSSGGAALQDIISVVSRRYPLCTITVANASVQGNFAAQQLISALDRVYEVADKVDLIIIGRGGGSTDDLFAFNDENLARKIYDSPIPVVSAVGHQTDFTLCDLVADLRAPTPSAAAELAVPDLEEILFRIKSIIENLDRFLRQKYQIASVQLSSVLSRPIFTNSFRNLDDKQIYVDSLIQNIGVKVKNKVDECSNSLMLTSQITEGFSPLKIMSRGYGIVHKENNIIKSISQVQIGDRLSVQLIDGKIQCEIVDKE